MTFNTNESEYRGAYKVDTADEWSLSAACPDCGHEAQLVSPDQETKALYCPECDHFDYL